MAHEAQTFESAIAAAAGDDQALQAELRASFADSLFTQLDLLRRARRDGNWQVAASRLLGLASAFHEEPLRLLAAEALAGVPGDPAILRQLGAHAAKYSPQT